MKRRNERQKGFTLIELLVVLIVIAVLAAVTVPALTSYLDDAREKKAVSEAQVCVTAATEWAAVQRTALISQAYQTNKSFEDAYNAAVDTAKWSNDYAALNTAAPTVTGTPALAEGDGQYFLRPETTPNDTTTDTMKNTVKTAAGVDGTLQNLQLNADGKVLYLLYTSAEGITVAYTAAGTAQTPDTTVPVATLPEDTTPTPSEPDDHSGDLVFCVLDEYTGEPVEGISFHLVDDKGNEVFGSRKTDDKGMVYFTLDPATLTTYYTTLKLVPDPDSWPEGCQQVSEVTVGISATYKQWTDPVVYDSYKIQDIRNNLNQSSYGYKEGFIGTLEGGVANHLCTFYVRSIPTLELRVLDEDNKPVKDVNFTLRMDSQSIDITSTSSPTLLDVKIHKDDKPRSTRTVMDMSHNSHYGRWIVDFTSVPEGYLYFDDCYLEIGLEPLFGHNNQLFTKSILGQGVNGTTSRTNIDCKNDYEHNKCIVTIHVKGSKTVNFFVYDGLESNPTTQLPNATMELYDSKNAKIATFITDGNGAGNFTETLSAGDYTLKLASNAPDGYDPPKDIPFKVERGKDGLLTIAGTGANASCVKNDESSVTMLVTKPDTMRFKLQIVDYNDGAKDNDPQWAGVNVRITGGALDTSFNDKREYAIANKADNEHTFDITKANSDENVTVTIVEGTKSSDGYNSKKHNSDYADNFVMSKFQFKLNKNSDGTFTLTPTNKEYALYGYIKGNTVYVYAYPKITLDYDCATYLETTPTPLLKEGKLTVTKRDGSSAYTVTDNTAPDKSFIQEWKMKGGRNHKVGIPLGDYELKNTKLYEWIVFEPYDNPWNFSIAQDPSGFPIVKDKNGQVINNKTVVATYKYKTSS